MVKNILLFVSGIIVGVVATFIFAVVSTNSGIVRFDEPGKEITSSPLQVIQVLSEGVALAEEHHVKYSDKLIVLLVSEGEHFYDDQIVYLSDGDTFKQIGVYTYNTNMGIKKTVPIVEALPK